MREVTRILSRVAETVRRERLLVRGDRVLVACSGGPDSTCLFDTLAALRQGLGLDALEVAYVDHGLRPESAPREADAVAARAVAAGVPFTRLDAAAALATARYGGASPEEAARIARYGALVAHAESRGLAVLAVGHTRTDQVETALLRLVTSGVLHGMPYARGEGPLRLVRPLLDVSALEILEYLRARGIVPEYDESNAHPDAPRNAVRLTVVPALRALNPRIEDAIGRALGRISRRPSPPRPRRPAAPETAVVVGGPGLYAVGDVRVAIGEGPQFDVAFPLVLRGLRPGDRMRPRGGRGSKKIVRLWRDAHVALADRIGVVLTLPADRGGDVLWAPGLRPSQVGRPADSAKSAPLRGFSVRIAAAPARPRREEDAQVRLTQSGVRAINESMAHSRQSTAPLSNVDHPLSTRGKR